MTLEDSIHTQRLRVLREAERLGNVSEACRRHGMARALFYRLRHRLEQYGPDGVHPKRRQTRRGRPAAIPVQTERRVMALALAWPTCGPQWYSDQLARDGVTVAATTIWRLLRRSSLARGRRDSRCWSRPARRPPGCSADGAHGQGGPPRRGRRAGRPAVARHFYVGKLKGVGKVWQITGCDVASSFAWARLVIGEVTAAAVLSVVREVVRPTYRQAGWRLKRVFTDNGLSQKSMRRSFSDLAFAS